MMDYLNFRLGKGLGIMNRERYIHTSSFPILMMVYLNFRLGKGLGIMNRERRNNIYYKNNEYDKKPE